MSTIPAWWAGLDARILPKADHAPSRTVVRGASSDSCSGSPTGNSRRAHCQRRPNFSWPRTPVACPYERAIAVTCGYSSLILQTAEAASGAVCADLRPVGSASNSEVTPIGHQREPFTQVHDLSIKMVIVRVGANGRNEVSHLPCHGSGHRLTLGMCEPYAQVSRSLVRRLQSRHGAMPAPKIGT